MVTTPKLHKPLIATGDQKERMAAGKALRDAVPISAHGAWSPPSGRTDPVALLRAGDEGRLAHLLPVKYGRMLSSPFAFLRGSARIMAADLATVPSTRIQTQLCGDAHIDNFGVFASPERKLVFDLNDFDETLPGPWEWDLKRLAVSAVVAAREIGLAEAACRDLVVTAVETYAGIVRQFSSMSTLEVWYYHVDVDRLQRLFQKSTRKASTHFRRTLSAARSRTHSWTLTRNTEVVDGKRRLRIAPPYVVPLSQLAADSEAGLSEADIEDLIERAWTSYVASLDIERQSLLARFRLTDAAFRIGGIGSVGTRCAIALLEGGGAGDAIILQQKEAGRSALEPFLGKSRYRTGAERVVHGQRLMQAASDIFLGWHRSDRADRQFYWRQLNDMAGSLDTAALGKAGFSLYVAVCAGALARAHGRAGDPAMMSGYIGKGVALARAVANFAVAYADQNERDHQALAKAAKAGKIAAETAG